MTERNRQFTAPPEFSKTYTASTDSIGQMSIDLGNVFVWLGSSREMGSRMAWHEYLHMMADGVRDGQLGYRVGASSIVAYYMVFGKRDPGEMMKIASAPGFGEMSGQDHNIYNSAKTDYYHELQEKDREKVREDLNAYIKIRNKLHELDRYGGLTPDQIEKMDFGIFSENKDLIKRAVDEVKKEINGNRKNDVLMERTVII